MQRVQRCVGWLIGWLLLATAAVAQPMPPGVDVPGRVGRVAETSGNVWIFDDEQGEWMPVQRNWPVTSGDRLSTGGGARAELHIGSTTLRLGARSEIEVVRLDDERLQLQLHSGSAALRVRSREIADETEFGTAEARFRPLRAGHYRFDREDEITYAAALHGELLLDGPVSFPIAGGTRMSFWLERGQRDVQHRWESLPGDEMAAWLAREDQQERRSAANRYVSPEMTGAEDLDRYGRWDRHPDYGVVWIPATVSVGWAPYRYGNWVWVRPWGWTWVDHQPWGFAPFHYGRWVHWRGSWCWSPGGYVARPVYSPGLVAWIGGPSVSIGISLGGRHLPGTSWVPLAPRDPWPHDRRSPPLPHRPIGGTWANQAVPNAVTTLTRDALLPRIVQPGAGAPPPLRSRSEPSPRGEPSWRSGPPADERRGGVVSTIPTPAAPRVSTPPPAAPRGQPAAPDGALGRIVQPQPVPPPQPAQPVHPAQPTPPLQRLPRPEPGLHQRPPQAVLPPPVGQEAQPPVRALPPDAPAGHRVPRGAPPPRAEPAAVAPATAPAAVPALRGRSGDEARETREPRAGRNGEGRGDGRSDSRGEGRGEGRGGQRGNPQ